MTPFEDTKAPAASRIEIGDPICRVERSPVRCERDAVDGRDLTAAKWHCLVDWLIDVVRVAVGYGQLLRMTRARAARACDPHHKRYPA